MSNPLNIDHKQILSNYESNTARTPLQLLGRKVLQFFTFGKASLNPELDRTIKDVLHAVPHVLNQDELVTTLKQLSSHAHSNHADKTLRHELDHTIGALIKTSEDQVRNRAEKEGFFTVNNPYEASSFALGTFSLFPVTHNLLNFTCVEAAFQAQKFENPEIQAQFVGLSGAAAQKLADKLKDQVQSDWDVKSFSVMQDLLRARSEQNPEYVKLLLASGSAFLVANSSNAYWGDGNGTGQNNLGQLLMLERKMQGGAGITPAPTQYYEKYQIATEEVYKVCSYNMGASLDDYMQLLGKIKPDEEDDLNAIWNDPDLRKDAAQEIQATRTRVQNQLVDFLFSPAQGDVFCLQEVTDSNKDLLKVLESRGFELSFYPNANGVMPDTVIAINKSKFKNIENQSFIAHNTTEVAMATAIDKKTKKKTTFVSAHLTGYILEKGGDAVTRGVEAGAQGNDQVKAIVKEVNQKCKDSDLVVFGGDFNTSPELYPARFDPLENAGYALHSTGEATNITTDPNKADVMTERPLDHFAVKGGGQENIRVEILKTPKEIGLDGLSNASDHLPIFLGIRRVVKEKGLFS